jgi:hypothetical protein
MSLEHATHGGHVKQWHSEKALPSIKVDSPWPSEIHSQISFVNGPSQGHLGAFMTSSNLRMKVWSIINLRSDKMIRPEFNISLEEMRRMKLKASGNIWYLEPTPYVGTPFEKLTKRTSVAVKGYINGRMGLRGVQKWYLWAPTALIAAAYYYRYAELGTI